MGAIGQFGEPSESGVTLDERQPKGIRVPGDGVGFSGPRWERVAFGRVVVDGGVGGSAGSTGAVALLPALQNIGWHGLRLALQLEGSAFEALRRRRLQIGSPQDDLPPSRLALEPVGDVDHVAHGG